MNCRGSRGCCYLRTLRDDTDFLAVISDYAGSASLALTSRLSRGVARPCLAFPCAKRGRRKQRPLTLPSPNMPAAPRNGRPGRRRLPGARVGVRRSRMLAATRRNVTGLFQSRQGESVEENPGSSQAGGRDFTGAERGVVGEQAELSGVAESAANATNATRP